MLRITEQDEHTRPGSNVHMHAVEAASEALFLAVAVGRSSVAGMRQPDAGWAACSPAVKAGCLAGLWELHTTACRAVHSVLAGTLPRQLVSPAVPTTAHLCTLVEPPFLAASAMYLHEAEIAAPAPEVYR